ncbi:MAG: AAA family ATPase [Lachnospiraceae bacterium]|nr:AAA family ATPase [Lachnospiraceae bacterium]
MNINEAKEYIKNSIQVYLKKDEFGDYRIPVVRQRPIFLLGAPGIGKTAIMEQIAQELSIALVSYSMTHHTRQSALGLPFIKHKSYEGMEYDVSEYTMSEIIASIYEIMENSGVKEGILFLDEINCVSETLAPSMLQFLQYKVFGKHKVPDGWVIVTAGNPPEYNKSVKEFDVVTMDRLKVLTVEADYPTWKTYAVERNIHSAIINFLEIKKEYFYHMETTAKGRSYVTARGWEDLSEIIHMYEEEGLLVEENLISQYLRNENVSKEFFAYYELFNKYKKQYELEKILEGENTEDAVKKAMEAEFDERISLLGILLDKVQSEIKDVIEESEYLTELKTILITLDTENDLIDSLDKNINHRNKLLNNLGKANALSVTDKKKHKKIVRFLCESKTCILNNRVLGEEGFNYIKEKYNQSVIDMKQKVSLSDKHIHNLFEFTDRAFNNGNEMLILVTELTAGKFSSKYMSVFGSTDYQKYSELLLIGERRNHIMEDIDEIYPYL